MSANEQIASSGDSPEGWQRVAILFVALLAVVHTILIAIWLAPSSPVRDAVGATRLATYVDPYFQQSWGSADPSAQFVDERLLIRAEVLTVANGKKRTTGWIDVTKVEQPALRHSLQPARVHVISRRLATNLNAASLGLNFAQKALVKKSYVKDSRGKLTKSLYAEGGAPGVVSNYLAYDTMTTQFATMYATSLDASSATGSEITKIQYKVGLKRVPSFKDRDIAAPATYTYFSFGWRKALPAQEDAQSEFDSYVKK